MAQARQTHTSYKLGSTICGAFDARALVGTTRLQPWQRQNTGATILEMVDTYRIVADPFQGLYLGGVTTTPGPSNTVGREDRALDARQREFLQRFIGFPFQAEVEIDFGIDPQNLDMGRIRRKAEVNGWLHSFTPDNNLVNITGIDGTSNTIWQAITNPTWRSTEANDVVNFPDGIPALFADNQAVFPWYVDKLTFITFPGRQDVVGDADSRQPGVLDSNDRLSNTITEGQIPLLRAQQLATINRDSTFRGTILSSQVTPVFRNLISGDVISRSRHILTLILTDRSEAGMQSTPYQLLDTYDEGIYELPQNSGRFYNPTRFEELPNDTTVVTFESVNNIAA